MTLKPADGAAVILHLIEAARALIHPKDGEEDFGTERLIEWTYRLESHLAEEIPAGGPVGWEARTWGEVLPGDRVSLEGVEADVHQAALLPWHVEPDPDPRKGVRQVWHPGPGAVDEETGAPEYCRGCKGRCNRGRGFQTFPREYSQMRVTLDIDGHGVKALGFNPDGEIEVLRGEQGRAADEAAGRGVALVKADRDMVLASWAAEAFETLAAAGLSPEPQVMTCGTD